MRRKISEIKLLSRNRLHNNFGDAFIIIFIPFFMMYALTIITGQLTLYLPPKVEFMSDMLIQVLLSIVSSYVTIKLIILYAKGRDGINFDKFFNFDRRLINYSLFRIIIAGIFVLMYLPMLNILKEFSDTAYLLADMNAISRYLQNSDIIDRMSTASTATSGLLIVFWLLTIRLQMIPFLIIDRKLNLVEAFKTSWQITKGSYFRILIFPFTYLLWLLLCLTFFGIFYVIPLFIVGYTYLYITLLEENGMIKVLNIPDSKYKDPFI